MKYKGLLIFLFCFYISHQIIYAQDSTDHKPAKITMADFDISGDESDTGANAIILTDIGKRTFERNEAGDYDIIFKRYTRIKIVNKNGLDAGEFTLRLSTLEPYHNIMIRLPKEGLIWLEGTTYNRVNGSIREDKLDQSAVISQQEGKNWVTVKFAMPALKEGSIFDIEYGSRCAFIVQNLEWNFQHKYPCIWSEYDLTLPDAYLYSIKYQGDSSFFINKVDPVYREGGDSRFQGKLLLSHFRWVKKNEPALIPEPYIGSLKNYEDKVSLLHKWYLRSYTNFNFYTSDTWEGFSHIYYILNGIEDFDDEKFGWLKKELEKITAGLQTKKDMSFAIYKYIRDHFSCTAHHDYFAGQALKETFRDKSGNVADLNLLLTAMLKRINIEAFPAVLSTLENGVGNLSFPLPNDYDYLICVADIDGSQFLLDASQPLNPFGKLPLYCYNGGAVSLNNKNPKLLSLLPDSLQEQNRTNVIMTSDEKGVLSGNITLNCSSQMSYALRENIKKTSLDKYLTAKITKNRVIHFSNEEAESLNDPDKPLTVACDIDFADSIKSDICYISPVIYSYFNKNPFSAVRRKYIIEMPYRMDNIYLLSMDIPKGYKVEEMPASTRISLGEKDGFFEYVIEKNGDTIQLQMRMKINKTFFTTDEYSNLREFFDRVVKKENEQIVFRKLK
jgi:hypothetical protein